MLLKDDAKAENSNTDTQFTRWKILWCQKMKLEKETKQRNDRRQMIGRMRKQTLEDEVKDIDYSDYGI